ncbi:SLC13 family permease [Shewanella psychrotolerans]|uniref:SLC13 family permease n=1 Tax=Shewanella psychrotolerans TaxID=2864206 RepID=UPI001C6558E9|nr:SLC13 family permease [Shewanella psychrotolerans]QYK02174.1 SLC13 family permease [Shewanella psychrotolerans]
MSFNQIIIVALLAITMAMFLWGKWRHDVVAMGALLVGVFTGLVPSNEAFASFGHPAVITVASVLVLGYGLKISGAVDVLAKHLLPSTSSPTLSIFALINLAALLSGFINNVGALALLMPIAIQMAAKYELPAGKVLMPLAFGSILGGMTTLIGTPTNMVVAGFRQSSGMGSFSMFDFSPVGVSVALAGIAFVGILGWRLVPVRKQSDVGSFDTGTYLSEVRIVAGSKAEKMNLRDVEKLLDEADAQIIAMIRREVRLSAPNPRRILQDGDILVIEVEPESLPKAISSLGLKLEADVSSAEEGEIDPKAGAEVYRSDSQVLDQGSDVAVSKSEEVVIQELVVTPGAALVNRSVTDIQLRTRYGINLLAISRQGRRFVKRLRSTPVKEGDVILLQGDPESVSGFASQFGCLPLAAREISVPQKGHAVIATLIMAIAVAAVAFGSLPAAVAFVAGALAFAILGIVPVRSIYTSIDWSVVVLLAALLPVANAMFTTGAADLIAQFLLNTIAQSNAIAALVLVLVVTMFLSDLMNNVATAAVMCPIGISTASQLGVNPDPFLMAIAVGASCAFLTPIGHQNNTLILGPGGFHFGDYWRLGLILEVVVVAVSVPMLLWVWPF